MTNRRIFNSYYFLSKTPEMMHWNDMFGHRNKQETTFTLTSMRKIALLDSGSSMDNSSSLTIRTQLQNSLLFYNPITETNTAHALNIQTVSPQLEIFHQFLLTCAIQRQERYASDWAYQVLNKLLRIHVSDTYTYERKSTSSIPPSLINILAL